MSQNSLHQQPYIILKKMYKLWRAYSTLSVMTWSLYKTSVLLIYSTVVEYIAMQFSKEQTLASRCTHGFSVNQVYSILLLSWKTLCLWRWLEKEWGDFASKNEDLLWIFIFTSARPPVSLQFESVGAATPDSSGRVQTNSITPTIIQAACF